LVSSIGTALKFGAGAGWTSTSLYAGGNAIITASATSVAVNNALLVGTTAPWNGGSTKLESKGGIGISGWCPGSGDIAVQARADNAGGWLFFGYGPSTTLTYTVAASGDVKNTNNSYGAISDACFKDNVTPAKSQIEDVRYLAGALKNYTLKADPEKRPQLGLVAQDVEARCPGLVRDVADYKVEDGERVETGTTHKELVYSIIPLKMLGAFGELLGIVDELKAQNAVLTASIMALKARLNT
jgi:hypothetical protein